VPLICEIYELDIVAETMVEGVRGPLDDGGRCVVDEGKII
jgi:hypothetical protein